MQQKRLGSFENKVKLSSEGCKRSKIFQKMYEDLFDEGNSNQCKKGLGSVVAVRLKLSVLSPNVLADGYEYIPDVTRQQFVPYAKKRVC